MFEEIWHSNHVQVLKIEEKENVKNPGIIFCSQDGMGL